MKRLLSYVLLGSLVFSGYSFSAFANSLNDFDGTTIYESEQDNEIQDLSNEIENSVDGTESSADSDVNLIEMYDFDGGSGIPTDIETDSEINDSEIIVDETETTEESNTLALSDQDQSAPAETITIDGIRYYLISDINQWNYVAEQKGD